MKALILKTGALGDVLRTSYFAKYMKELNLFDKIDWFTSCNATPLISNNPYIDNIYVKKEFDIYEYDRIFSLDDEYEVIEIVRGFPEHAITGAYMAGNRLSYSPDSSEWFDMGLISKFGKIIADQKKLHNQRSHIEIFQDIFHVNDVVPNSYFKTKFNRQTFKEISITPASGARWPSKSLHSSELANLSKILEQKDFTFKIIGTKQDLEKYRQNGSISLHHFSEVNSIQELADEIYNSRVQITADTLALHIGQSFGRNLVSFFTATSANEIPNINNIKILSTADDYCTYRPAADNLTITADRIYDAILAYV